MVTICVIVAAVGKVLATTVVSTTNVFVLVELGNVVDVAPCVTVTVTTGVLAFSMALTVITFVITTGAIFCVTIEVDSVTVTMAAATVAVGIITVSVAVSAASVIYIVGCARTNVLSKSHINK